MRRAKVTADALIGRWKQIGDQDYISSVEYRISKGRGALEVAATDTRDGEHLEVSGVREDGSSLTFETYCPSTGHRATITMTLKGKSQMDLVISTSEREIWKKIGA